MSNPPNQVERSNRTSQSARRQTQVGRTGSSRATRPVVDPVRAALPASKAPIEMVASAHQNLLGGLLSTADYARLEQRWICRDYADGARLRRVTSIEGAEIVGRQGKPGEYDGIIIPYFNPLNGWLRDYRLRRDHPEIEFDNNGNRKECHRYLAPPGKGNMLYVPVGAGPELLQNTELPLVITEGEFKTIALWRAAWYAVGESSNRPSYLPIGLSGVYNWRTRTPKTVDSEGYRVDAPGPIADLLWIAWSGRLSDHPVRFGHQR